MSKSEQEDGGIKANMESDKEKLILKNVRKWQAGKPPALLKVEIQPTHKCNLSCVFCRLPADIQRYLERNEMTDEQLRHIVRECLDMSVREVLFSGGGEPWMRGKLLLELMKEVKAAKREGFLITNGTLFSHKDIKDIVDIRWDCVMFSIDGPTPEVHDTLRRKKGTFERTVGRLRSFVNERGLKGGHLPVFGINFVITSKNVHLVERMVRFAADERCDFIYFQAMMDINPGCVPLRLDEKQQSDFIAAAAKGVKFAKRLGIRTNLGDYQSTAFLKDSKEVHKIITQDMKRPCDIKGWKKNVRSLPCYEAWNGISVDSDGRISICMTLAETSPLRISEQGCNAAWKGPEIEKVRAMMVSGDISRLCTRCCTEHLFESKHIRDST